MTDDEFDDMQADYDLCGVDGRLRDFAEAVQSACERAAHAAVASAAADERARWESALRQTWQAIDPLKPAGQPGSYARGYDNGFAAALEVLRGNLKA